MLAAIKAFFVHIFTDAAGRPEIKMILGVPLFLVAVVYGMASHDWVGFGALSGVALTLMGITAAGDSVIDKAKAILAPSAARGQP